MLWSLDIKNSALEERRYAMVNIYSPVLSARDGNDIFSEEHLGELSVPMQLVKEKHLDVACLRAEGDSMEQKINNSAYVIIDTSKKEIIDNKIYAFNINNVIRIKRLFNALDGIIIRSDNIQLTQRKKLPLKTCKTMICSLLSALTLLQTKLPNC